jgi:hypothetical protein
MHEHRVAWHSTGKSPLYAVTRPTGLRGAEVTETDGTVTNLIDRYLAIVE